MRKLQNVALKQAENSITGKIGSRDLRALISYE
jgi:hypothetical protein